MRKALSEGETLSLAAEIAAEIGPQERPMPTVALIPAAGQASRLGRLPVSKELLPVGFRRTRDGSISPQVALQHLFDHLSDAEVESAYVLLRRGKGDIPAYFGTGDEAGLPLAYLTGDPTGSVPETLDRAFPFVSEARVVFGFPDVLFEPKGAFRRLLEHQESTGADIVLGLFPAPDCRITDMVELDDEGRVRRIEVRPRATDLAFNWLIAVWTPTFTRFLHDEVCQQLSKQPDASKQTDVSKQTAAAPRHREFQLGSLFERALLRRMDVRGVPFPHGAFVDLGTPENLAEAQRLHAHLPRSD